MGLITTDSQYYEDIADAIREVNGTDDTFTPSDMALAIRNLGSVKGVKGDSEEEYRTGYVNITPANIGAMPANAVPASSESATKDADGNVISTTYEKVVNVTSKGDATLPVYFDVNGVAIPISSYSGNSNTASKWHTPVMIKVGNTSKEVDGSAAITYTKDEIGFITANVDGETLVLK